MLRNLEAEQKRFSLTNSEVADRLEISRATYESKKKTRKFTKSEIVTLLSMFNCKFEYLFAMNNIQSA